MEESEGDISSNINIEREEGEFTILSVKQAREVTLQALHGITPPSL